MRLLERNKQDIYYATFLGVEDILDENGSKTGEKKSIYSNPIKTKCHVSTSNGEIAKKLFGNIEDYDKLLIHEIDCSFFSKNTIFWIDSLDTSKPHDYEVSKIVPSLNFIGIGINKVMING